eukprot:CAMPEP_0202865866 /NCGR_PEP_ID=MMETSP1391-20130828/6587_1 /ASSEMBLY_ACC=CAM_ASM_000867 /TAXON_ID=1034604 /ORGANISM="Chlamydomonas leiostraca, Strain SAG 11-49" /LENGTH=326 /DNA_ID=CAMNT_0049545749 /DNA_START=258 /DNA_END=1238 /DNA_ORIENTATION=+
MCAALVFGTANPALAARSGGRVGGSSFGSSRASSSFSSPSSRSSSSSSFGSSRSSSSYPAPTRGYTSRTTVITPAPSVSIGVGIPLGGYGYSSYGGTYGGGYVSDPLSTTAATLASTMAIVAIVMFTASSLKAASQQALAEPTTVAKLQVGVLRVGGARLKRDLDALAESADTGSARGLHALAQDVVLALMRHPECIAYADTATRGCSSPEEAESEFGSMALVERAHFKEETLTNVRGRGVRRARLSERSDEVDEYLVVTLVVAASGAWSLPAIKTPADVRAALRTIGGLSPTSTLAVELTWTPQADGDSMTADQLLIEFPNLKPV